MKMTVYFFPNGNTVVFDEKGKQVTELQASWLLLFVRHLVDHGIDPVGVTYHLPDGMKNATLFKIDDGYNWDVERRRN